MKICDFCLFLELPLVAAATTIPLLVVPKPPVLIKIPVFRLAEPFQTILKTSVFVLENHQNTSKLCLVPAKVGASKLPNGFRQLFHGEVKTFAPDLERTGWMKNRTWDLSSKIRMIQPKKTGGISPMQQFNKKRGLQWWPLICTMESQLHASQVGWFFLPCWLIKDLHSTLLLADDVGSNPHCPALREKPLWYSTIYTTFSLGFSGGYVGILQGSSRVSLGCHLGFLLGFSSFVICKKCRKKKFSGTANSPSLGLQTQSHLVIRWPNNRNPQTYYKGHRKGGFRQSSRKTLGHSTMCWP